MLRLIDRRDIATTLRGASAFGAGRAKLKQRRKEKYTETFVGRAQERLTVNERLDAYYANRELASGGSMKNLRSAIKTLREAFGTWRAPDVTLPRFEQWAVQRSRVGAGPGTIKHRLGILAAAFKVTRRLWFHHYTPDFPQIRTPQARQGFFEPEQFERVRAALAHDLRRTFVRDAENANVPRSSGKAVTGHTSDQMYERLRHPHGERCRVRDAERAGRPGSTEPQARVGHFTDRGEVGGRCHMMTSAEHDARCQKVLYVDLKFGTDCRWLGVSRDRLYCVDGHSVYVDVTPPPAVEREAKPRLSELCSRCNEPFDAGLDLARSYCPPCLKVVQAEHARRVFVRKPGEPKAKNSGVCPACSTPLERDRRYCDAVCRQTHLANRRAARKARQEEAMAGAFA